MFELVYILEYHRNSQNQYLISNKPQYFLLEGLKCNIVCANKEIQNLTFLEVCKTLTNNHFNLLNPDYIDFFYQSFDHKNCGLFDRSSRNKS